MTEWEVEFTIHIQYSHHGSTLSRFSVSLPFPAEKPHHLNHSGHVRGSDPVCVVFRAVLARGSCHEACASLLCAYLWRALSFGYELRGRFLQRCCLRVLWPAQSVGSAPGDCTPAWSLQSCFSLTQCLALVSSSLLA